MSKNDERIAREYATTTITFEAQSAPEIVETHTIHGEEVAVVRYARMEAPAKPGDAPVFGHEDALFAAVRVGDGIEVAPLSVTFYDNDGEFHKAGDRQTWRPLATAARNEVARCATIRATLRAAAQRIERDQLWAKYAPVAEKNIHTHTCEEFDALDPAAEIEPGDLVVVYSHQRYRTGVAIRVTPTKVECLAATPSTKVANGATRKKGEDVRLLRKATQGEQMGAAIRARAERTEAADALAAECERYDHGTYVSGCPAHPNSQWPNRAGQTTPDAAAVPAAAAAPAPAGGPATVEDALEAAGFPVARPGDGDPGDMSGDAVAGRPVSIEASDERRAVAGRLFAASQGMGDAVAGCTAYRMVRARVGAQELRIHGEAGELLGAIAAQGGRFRAETPDGRALTPREGGALFGSFVAAVAAVRLAGRSQTDGHDAGEVPGEEDDMGQTESPADDRPVVVELICEAREGTDTATIDRAEWNAMTPAQRAARVEDLAADHVNDQGGYAWHIADKADYESVGDSGRRVRLPADPAAALLVLVAEWGIEPATLRAVADQVERARAGHVTEIEVDSVGHFGWRCVQGDADQTGIETGEEAYRAATAHGPLVADSPFVRGPVIEHDGLGCDTGRGMPRRRLGGSLRWESFSPVEDDGEWRLEGYGSTTDVEEGDVAGAHAWAFKVLARGDYDVPPVTVARWEHHRDAYGEWWEPVVR